MTRAVQAVLFDTFGTVVDWRTGISTLDEFGLRLTQPEIDELNHAWERLPPWPDSVEGLTLIRRTHIIGPLSNGNVGLLTRMAKAAGLPWDVVIGSDVTRRYKPQPDAYLRAASLLELPPGRVMLAAAHNDDLAAARDVGLATAFVPRPTEHGPAQTTDLNPESDWDVVAADLVDLAHRLAPETRR